MRQKVLELQNECSTYVKRVLVHVPWRGQGEGNTIREVVATVRCAVPPCTIPLSRTGRCNPKNGSCVATGRTVVLLPKMNNEKLKVNLNDHIIRTDRQTHTEPESRARRLQALAAQLPSL